MKDLQKQCVRYSVLRNEERNIMKDLQNGMRKILSTEEGREKHK